MSGSIVVPVAPTDEMLLAAHEATAVGCCLLHSRETKDIWSAMLAAAPAPSSLAGGEVLKALLDYIDIQTCMHESIKRGGAIWTICEDCGRKWADDEGGFKPHVDAPAVAAAREYLAALSPEAPARVPGWPEGLLTTALTDELQDGGAEVPYSIIAERVAARVADEASAPSCLTPCHEAPAEGAGERTKGAAELQAELDQLANEYGDLLAEVEALRARSSAPEAREEALGNLLAVIHGDGGHRALEVGTKQAALEAEKIVAGLFAAPSVDKLRIAVEALEPLANLGVSSGPDDEPCHYAYRITRGAIRNARQALAALKAEGA